MDAARISTPHYFREEMTALMKREPKQKQHNRIEASVRSSSLDIIKGICIILVVLCHAVDLHSIIYPIGQILEGFFLNGFFMVSGWLAYNKTATGTTGIKLQLTRKLKRLIVPYLSFSLLTIIWHIIICVGFNNTFVSDSYTGWMVIWRDLFCVISGLGIGTLWFLPVLFISYAALTIIIGITNTKRIQPYRYICLIDAFLLFVALSIPLGRFYVTPTSWSLKLANEYMLFLYRIINGCAYSLLGYMFHENWPKTQKKRLFIIPLSLIATAICLFFQTPQGILNMFLCLFIFATLMSILEPFEGRPLTLLTFAGKNSLAIMIIHYNFLFPIEKLVFDGWILFAVNILTTLLVVLLLQNNQWFQWALGNTPLPSKTKH